MWPVIGAGISALGSLFGGLFNRKSQSEANQQNLIATAHQNQLNREMQERMNALAAADAERRLEFQLRDAAINRELQVQEAEKNRAMQLDFAKSGIQWRVDDARAAGIHPIYALGGSGASYSPSAVSVGNVSLGSGPSYGVPSQSVPTVEPSLAMGNAFASFGQDIGRAINATRTALGRDEAFETSMRMAQLTKVGLENDLLASQIAKLKASQNPPMPVGVPEASKFEERPLLTLGMDGKPYKTDPRIANAEDFEKRYGEISDWLMGPYILYRDYVHNTGGLGAQLYNDWERMRARDRVRPPGTLGLGAP